MDLETLYDALDWMDIDDQLDLLDSRYYDLYMDPHPEYIIQRFYNISSKRDADTLASIFMDQLGDVVICRQASRRLGQFLTLVDTIECDLWNTLGKTLILQSFQEYGFERSMDCDQRTLIDLYTDCPIYELTIGDVNIMYDYQSLKREHAAISRELQEYIYHPDKIAKWILADNDLEDYMC